MQRTICKTIFFSWNRKIVVVKRNKRGSINWGGGGTRSHHSLGNDSNNFNQINFTYSNYFFSEKKVLLGNSTLVKYRSTTRCLFVLKVMSLILLSWTFYINIHYLPLRLFFLFIWFNLLKCIKFQKILIMLVIRENV